MKTMSKVMSKEMRIMSKVDILMMLEMVPIGLIVLLTMFNWHSGVCFLMFLVMMLRSV